MRGQHQCVMCVSASGAEGCGCLRADADTDLFSSAWADGRYADNDFLTDMWGRYCFYSLNLYHKNYTMMITNVAILNLNIVGKKFRGEGEKNVRRRKTAILKNKNSGRYTGRSLLISIVLTDHSVLCLTDHSVLITQCCALLITQYSSLSVVPC